MTEDEITRYAALDRAALLADTKRGILPSSMTGEEMTPTAEITAQAVYAAAQEALARIAASVERLAHVYPMSNNPYWGLQGEIAAEAASLPGGSPNTDAGGVGE